jgi:twitching motility protein PilJ
VDRNNIEKLGNHSSSSPPSVSDSHQDFVSKLTSSLREINSPQAKRSLWQWFFNLSVGRKQLIALIASEVISIIGLTVVGRFLISSNLQAILLEQAKSELAVTNVAYNIKVNQMGFGFRGQSDNTAIIRAARLYDSSQYISDTLRSEVKQILANEIKARNIEYATLVGKDYKIIVNANADRQGEIFNPDNLVSEVINFPKQIRASSIVNWSEIRRESPPLPPGFKNSDALIRYTVTPVKDPATNIVIGALVSGDIVNGKDTIVKDVLDSTGGGYSAIYVHQPTGEFILAKALLENESLRVPNVQLPKESHLLLKQAAASAGNIVTKRIQLSGQNYTIAAKSLPNKSIQSDGEIIPSFNQQPVAILVRGTPETALNQLLANSFWVQLLAILVATVIVMIWGLILKQTIINPIQKLQQSTFQYAAGDRNARAKIFATDEIGQLAITFNQLTDKVTQQFIQQEEDVKIAKLVHEMTARCRTSLNSQYILNAAVTSIYSAIQADRVVVYKFDDNWQGTVIAEAVNPDFPISLGAIIADPCFADNYVEKYQKGRVQAVTNINAAGLTSCHIAQLEEFGVKANLVAPILINKKLYGLLIAHQCSKPRQWKEFEINLFKQVTIPIAYALEQASLTEKIDSASSRAEQISDEQRLQQETLQQQVAKLIEDISAVSKADLTVKAKVVPGEIGIVAENINLIIDNLTPIIAKVQLSASKVNTAVHETEEAAQHLSQQTLQQVNDVKNILGKLEEIASSITILSENAQEVVKVSNLNLNNVRDGKNVVDLTVENVANMRECIDSIVKRSKRIGEFSQEIVSTINLMNEIGTRTNLLAVNAELQAAKVNQSASYATFATDLGDLAIRYASTTQEVEQMIGNMQQEAQEVIKAVEMGISEMVKGTDTVDDAKTLLNQILNLSQQIDELVQFISQTAEFQLETSQVATNLMQSISQNSELNSDYSNKITQSLQQTVDISKELQAAINEFKIQ